jgi:hypothetical protein
MMLGAVEGAVSALVALFVCSGLAAAFPSFALVGCTSRARVRLLQALQRRLAVPDWDSFTANVTSIYELVKRTEFGGKNADYISVLSEQVRWTRPPGPTPPPPH